MDYMKSTLRLVIRGYLPLCVTCVNVQRELPRPRLQININNF